MFERSNERLKKREERRAANWLTVVGRFRLVWALSKTLPLGGACLRTVRSNTLRGPLNTILSNIILFYLSTSSAIHSSFVTDSIKKPVTLQTLYVVASLASHTHIRSKIHRPRSLPHNPFRVESLKSCVTQIEFGGNEP